MTLKRSIRSVSLKKDQLIAIFFTLALVKKIESGKLMLRSKKGSTSSLPDSFLFDFVGIRIFRYTAKPVPRWIDYPQK